MNSASAKKLKFKATTATATYVYHAGQGHCMARKSTIKEMRDSFLRQRKKFSACSFVSAVVCSIASYLFIVSLYVSVSVNLSQSCSGQLVKFSSHFQSHKSANCVRWKIQHTHPEIHWTVNTYGTHNRRIKINIWYDLPAACVYRRHEHFGTLAAHRQIELFCYHFNFIHFRTSQIVFAFFSAFYTHSLAAQFRSVRLGWYSVVYSRLYTRHSIQIACLLGRSLYSFAHYI